MLCKCCCFTPLALWDTLMCKVLCSFPLSDSWSSSVHNVCRSEADLVAKDCSIGGHGPAGDRSFNKSGGSSKGGQRFWSSRQRGG